MSRRLHLDRLFQSPHLAQSILLQRRIIIKDETGALCSELEAPESIRVIVHPTRPDDMQLLPEGERYIPAKKIISETAIEVGDIVHIEGKKWRIAALGNWSDYGFYNAIGLLHEGVQAPFAPAFKLR